jgi:hypothetical protein
MTTAFIIRHAFSSRRRRGSETKRSRVVKWNPISSSSTAPHTVANNGRLEIEGIKSLLDGLYRHRSPRVFSF